MPVFHADDGHSVELHPRALRDESAPPRLGLTALRSAARSARSKARAASLRSANSPSWLQRCTVVALYTKGGSPGKWKSIARYIARESANPGGLGFTQTADAVPIVEPVRDWRKLHKDEILWRIIISPEFGDRADIQTLVRDTMAALAKDLNHPGRLEWVAAVHRNTDNPHAHVLLRGRRSDGSVLSIPSTYIRGGKLRARAMEALTVQLGPRTEYDITEAMRREVRQSRFTGLDRKIRSRAAVEGDWLRIEIRPDETFLLERAAELQRMSLAHPDRPGDYQNVSIARHFEESLRAMQKTRDRQKMMIDHGFMPLKPNLPFRVVRAKELDRVEGRILVHGHNEYSGANFMLVETDTEILQVPHTKEIALARQHGNCPAGHAVLIERTEVTPPAFRVQDMGPSYFAGPAI